MNIENLQFKGQLADAKKKFHNLDTEASGLIILIRSLLSPYQEDVSTLDVEKVTCANQRLHQIVFEIRLLKDKIAKLEAHFD